MGKLLKQCWIAFLLTTIHLTVFAQAIIDADVRQVIVSAKQFKSLNVNQHKISVLIFLHSSAEKELFINEIKQAGNVTIQEMGFMPAVMVQLPNNRSLFDRLANSSRVAQISLYNPAAAELDKSAQILKLAPSSLYPDVNNWWAHGFTGKKGILGLIDTGVDEQHPALSGKQFIVRKEQGSDYSNFLNGVKAPHATGVACIYASNNEQYKGIAYDTPTIIHGLAGEETADTSSIMLTMSTLDWMLNRAELTPTIINYSMGNGRLDLNCPACPEWSGLAKVIDYVVNTQKILWVKSAGNAGDITPTYQFPFASTLTVPGDNYNGLTVANMDTFVTEQDTRTKTVDRTKHRIRNTSSRGPTPFGRRKPDITAPGHDTRTCAPDPGIYGFIYTSAMDYKDGYRLMGGTSSAAPHVGASVLLLQDAGIQHPIAIKALLINSADTWADDNAIIADATHKIGSYWNRTYGWGYINMEEAFRQKDSIIESELTPTASVWEYPASLKAGEKVTLVHERRVGYAPDGHEWKLSHLKLELIDGANHTIIDSDTSPIDTVHQVANCKRQSNQLDCINDDKITSVLIRVTLVNKTIEGSHSEPFAIVIPRR